MRKVKIGTTEIEYYDAIEDLPIRRYHKYNKMLLIDAGIGGDLYDLDGHIERALRFNAANRPADANKELANLRHNIYMIQNEISPKFRAFAALVVSINGKRYDDYTDDGISEIIDALKDVPVKDITATLEAVKKKISGELKMYFPKMGETAEIKEYYNVLISRTLAVLDSIVNGENRAEEINDITTKLVTFKKPYNFDGEANAEVICDKEFEVMCHVITENTGANAKSLSVMEYYTAYEYTKDKIQARENAYKRK